MFTIPKDNLRTRNRINAKTFRLLWESREARLGSLKLNCTVPFYNVTFFKFCFNYWFLFSFVVEFNHGKLQLVFLNSECLNSSENFAFVYFLLTPISKVKVNRMKSVLLCDCRFESIAGEILICDYGTSTLVVRGHWFSVFRNHTFLHMCDIEVSFFLVAVYN